VAIPAEVQSSLNLRKRDENHLVLVSIRRRGSGYWNRHYLKLTFDNEFVIPADVSHLKQGDEVEVKVHRVIPDVSAEEETGQRSFGGRSVAGTGAGGTPRLAV
jgi:hypothetical protein